jgi:MSHA biogenesis protein MshM
LSIAGYRGPRVFSSSAIKRLHKTSGGVPRLVNILAHKALLAAFGEGVYLVKNRHVGLAAADTESTQTNRRSAVARYVAALLGTLLVSAGALLWAQTL